MRVELDIQTNKQTNKQIIVVNFLGNVRLLALLLLLLLLPGNQSFVHTCGRITPMLELFTVQCIVGYFKSLLMTEMISSSLSWLAHAARKGQNRDDQDEVHI